MTFDPNLEEKLSYSEDFEALLAAFGSGSTNTVSAIGFLNPFSYPVVANNAGLRDGFDKWFVDGSLLCRLSNLFRSRRLDRVSFDFSSIAHGVLSYCNTKGLRIGLLGGTAEEVSSASRYLAERYPQASFVFVEHGYFPDNEIDEKIECLVNQGVQVAIVGLGTPKQEQFVLRLKENAKGPALLFTCGGFLSQTGLSGDYYPNWVKRTGLRWLYRAMRHRHVRKRLVIDYPKFVVTYLASGVWLSIVKKG